MLIVFYLVVSLSVLQTAKVMSRPLRSYRDTDCLLWYFDHLQCCNTGMSCCSHRICHLICHSTQTLRPAVLSVNVIEINNELEVFVQISKTDVGFGNNRGRRPRLLQNPNEVFDICTNTSNKLFISILS